MLQPLGQRRQMTDAQLTKLWAEVTRTAKPDARVLYRTAATPDVVAGHVPDEILRQWEYADKALLDDWTRRDRSSSGRTRCRPGWRRS